MPDVHGGDGHGMEALNKEGEWAIRTQDEPKSCLLQYKFAYYDGLNILRTWEIYIL